MIVGKVAALTTGRQNILRGKAGSKPEQRLDHAYGGMPTSTFMESSWRRLNYVECRLSVPCDSRPDTKMYALRP